MKNLSIILITIIMVGCASNPSKQGPMELSEKHPVMQDNEANQEKVLNTLKEAFGSKDKWKISTLKGGLSGAAIFTADNGHKNYVVRYFDHLPNDQSERLILNQKNAWLAGYGPKVHWSDISQRVIVMDYLRPDQPFNVLKNISALLKKIHQSPKVGSTGRIWERTYSIIEELKKIKQSLIILDLVKSKLDLYVTQASKDLESKTCHRDLNPTNLIFSGGQFFAVDYDSIGIDDPYIDIAQIAIFYCHTRDAEIELLSFYLGRHPHNSEMAKLELFKKIAFIFYGIEFLRQVPSESWDIKQKLMPFKQYLGLLGEGKERLENPSEKLKFGLILIHEATQ